MIKVNNFIGSQVKVDFAGQDLYRFAGSNHYNLALLCHDFAYTRNRNGWHYIENRQLADELLRQMCIMSGELGSFRAAPLTNARTKGTMQMPPRLWILGGRTNERWHNGYKRHNAAGLAGIPLHDGKF